MKIRTLLMLFITILVLASCGGENKNDSANKAEKPEVKKEETVAKTETQPTVKGEIPIDMNDKGIGPVKSLTLGDIDPELAAKGKENYKLSCTACHKFKKKYIGPGLKYVTERRSPEWIMNMMLNPEEMLKKNKIAKALIAEYAAPMANQQLKEEDARAILEYFRLKDKDYRAEESKTN